jgi:dTDP-4-dehydrorhamnose reductase
MRAIRRVNPGAKFVCTEDLGRTDSTPVLSYQAEHDNRRRWLALDLLFGRVGPDHPFYQHLVGGGIDEAQLADLAADPCPPDMIGINHYLTSNRFLDENRAVYPRDSWGGNGRHHYADVAAVRVHTGVSCHAPLDQLIECWNRYEVPLAVTEVHNGSTREEQLRWLGDVWKSACRARAAGVDVRALTPWSLMGAVDWNSLLTERRGYYENGAFDVRGPAPRATAVAKEIEALARCRRMAHPVLDGPGWWRRPERFLVPKKRIEAQVGPGGRRRLLIVGAKGMLGRAFERACATRGLAAIATGREEVDVTNEQQVAKVLDEHRPWAVINAAGFTDAAHAEMDQERCLRENAAAPALLARACSRRSVRLLTFSCECVFDGRAGRPYVESDTPSPIGVLARSKFLAEKVVSAFHPAALIIRTSLLFGALDRDGSDMGMPGWLWAAGSPRLHADIVSPTYVPDLIDLTLDLLIDGERGIWHLTNEGQMSWREFSALTAEGRAPTVRDLPSAPGREPRTSALASERGKLMPPLEWAIGRYLADRGPVRPGAVAAAAS